MPKPASILIVKTSALGDIVHAYPALQYLRRCCPEAHISWVVERACAELVAGHPAVDECILADTQRWRRSPLARDTWRSIAACRSSLRTRVYDVVLDFQGNIKSALITSQVRSSCKVGFAAGYVAERPNLWAMHRHILPPSGQNIRADYLHLAVEAIEGPPVESSDFAPVALRISEEQQAANKNLLQPLRSYGDPIAVLFAGSAWPNKQLTTPILATFLAYIEKNLGMRWLLAWGSPAEYAMANELVRGLDKAQVIERLPLPQLQNLLSHVDVAVSMDSLPLHLAATTQVATYSFFGPSSAAKYAPEGSRHASFQGPCPYAVSFAKRCPKLRSCPTGLCLHGLDALILAKHFKTWWCEQQELLIKWR